MPVPRSLIESLLAEDVPGEDLTTTALGIGIFQARMEFKARGAMTVAGTGIAAALIRQAGGAASITVRDGERAEAGALLLRAQGSSAALHMSWKAAQTLTEILSGIATAARATVDAVEAVDPKIRVACTRKTFPGGRHLSLLAIRAGGAIPHRLGLSETILVFAEHRAFLSGMSFRAILERLRHEAPEKKLGIEVATVGDAREAVEAGFDIIQLEKMTPADTAEIAGFAKTSSSKVLLAAAGGISPANAGAYVKGRRGLDRHLLALHGEAR